MDRASDHRRGPVLLAILLVGSLVVFVASPSTRIAPPEPSGDLRIVLLKSKDSALALRVPTPLGGLIEIVGRSRDGGRVAFSLSCDAGPSFGGEILLPRSTRFTRFTLAPVPRSCGAGAADLNLRLFGRGVAVDAIEIIDGGGRRIAVEAESATGTFLTEIDRTASAGMAVATSRARVRPEIRQTLRAASGGLEGVVLRHLPFRSGWLPLVRAELREVGADEPIYSGPLTRRRFDGDAARITFPAIEGSADRSYELILRPPGRVPLAVWSGARLGELEVDGVRYAESVPLVPVYRSTAAVVGWTALPIVWLAVVAGFRSESASRWAFAVLLPAVGAVSFAYWQRDYVFESRFEFQPDGYDTLALLVRAVLLDPSEQPAELLWRYLERFPHAHNALPAFAAGALGAAGLEITGAFLVLALAASCAAAWSIHRALRVVTGDWRIAWAGVCLLATHYLFVRSAVRTCSDAVGLAFGCVTLAIAVVAWSSGRPAVRPILLMIGTATAGAFARLSTLSVAPAIAAAWLAGTWLLPRRRRRPGELPLILSLAVVPAAVLILVVHAAGVGDSFRLASEKLALFAPSRTAIRGVACLAVLLQLVPLAFLRARPAITSGTTLFGGSALLAAVALPVVTGIPYSARHLVPALPGLAIAAGPVLGRTTFGIALVAGSAAINLAIVASNLWNATGIGPPHLIH